MAYSEKDDKSNKELVDETHDLFKTYSNKRELWAQAAQEDAEFRLGRDRYSVRNFVGVARMESK